MNETGEFLKIDLKGVEKIDKTHLKVQSECDLMIDLDNEWHVSTTRELLKDKKLWSEVQCEVILT